MKRPLAILVACLPLVSHAELPVKASTWLVQGAVVDQIVGNTLNLKQSTNKAILQWDSFNIGAKNTVNFIQPGSGSATLNRILGGSPSEIFGRLNANGQVYLLNRNGIIFEPGSQVDVHGLFASTLNVTDEVFDAGILSPIRGGNPAFKPFTDAGGGDLPSADIRVDDGASLRVGSGVSGGYIRLFAPNVRNSGDLLAPDGQVILAAGQKVFLTASRSDDFFRGLVVEVEGGGEVTNSRLGDIVTARGNTTLMGLAVNQLGRVSASSSVSLNGSVRLLARELAGSVPSGFADISFFPNRGDPNFGAQRTGKVILGSGSVTEVLTETTGDTRAIDGQDVATSRVEIMGHQVQLKAQSLVSVPNGVVTIDAAREPGTFAAQIGGVGGLQPIARDTAARIQLDQGAVIDVSGNSAVVPMTSNALQVELRGSQLRNAPQQLNGPLRGASVTVDIRKGTPLADISADLDGVERSLSERTIDGGSVVLRSAGEIRILGGSRIDLSAGHVLTEAGIVGESLLMTTDGRLVRISEAEPGQQYRGVFDVLQVSHEKWRLADFDPTEVYDTAAWLRGTPEPAYTTGGNAGSLQLAAPVIVFDGDISADTVRGEYQRRLGELPRGAELIIGLIGGEVAGNPDVRDFLAPALKIARKADLAVELDFARTVAEQAPELADRLVIDQSLISAVGFQRINLFSNVEVVLDADAPIVLGPGASLHATAPKIELKSAFSSPAGELALNAVDTNPGLAQVLDAGIFIADNVAIDVSGSWTNDSQALGFAFASAAAIILEGGSITLDATFDVAGRSRIVLGDAVSFRLDGGAALTNDGRFVGGRGGELTLRLGSGGGTIELGRNPSWTAFGAAEGGSLRLEAASVLVDASASAHWRAGQVADEGTPLRLPPSLFGEHGFQTFDVRANDGHLGIADGTRILATLSNQIFAPAAGLALSGTAISDISDVARLPLAERGAVTLGFAVDTTSSSDILHDLIVGTRAAIMTDAGGEVRLWNNNGGSLIIDGLIQAPAGAVSLELSGSANADIDALTYVYEAHRGIALGANARIDTRGVLLETPNDLGLRTGTVLDGGAVNIRSNGFFYLGPGAAIDTRGHSATISIATADVGALFEDATTREIVAASRGGDVTLAMAEGGRFDGVIAGAGGGESALGGGLTIQLDVNLRNVNQFNYPTDQREIRVGNSAKPATALGPEKDSYFGGSVSLAAALKQPPGPNGVLALDAAELSASGFSTLRLATAYATTPTSSTTSVTTPGLINFVESTRLSADYLISLDAPVIAGGSAVVVNVAAPFVRLGQASLARIPASLLALDGFGPTSGDARLRAEAQYIELAGSSALRGFATTSLTSASDIRLRAAGESGEFRAAGRLNLHGQLYGTSFSEFTLAADDITIAGHRNTPLLSFASQLNLTATNAITQNGIVKAPFGAITLHASEVVFGPGSVTSVAGDGIVVAGGYTEGSQATWRYGAQDIFADSVNHVPQKSISVNAGSISVRAGATVNLNGGGTVQLYEYLPAPGGEASEDPLLAGNSSDSFAILPWLSDEIAPYDLDSYFGVDQQRFPLGLSLQVLGDSAALAAGRYALLPARYALLPGAVLVTRETAFDGLGASAALQLADGSDVLAALPYLAGTNARPYLTQAFSVQSRAQLLSTADYLLTDASAFVHLRSQQLETRIPRLPRDAGRLVLGVGQALSLAGNIVGNAARGRGLELDIWGRQLALLGAGDAPVPGAVNLLSADLARTGASSILIGGERAVVNDDLHIRVESEALVVGARARLKADELLLAAHTRITTQPGSRLESIGASTKQSGAAFERVIISQPKRDVDGNALNFEVDPNGDFGIAPNIGDPIYVAEGAFVHLTSGKRVPVSRVHNDPLAAGAIGSLLLKPDSVLAVSGALTLSAVGPSEFDARFIVNGGAVEFSSTRISLGDTAGRGIVDGLVFDQTRLADLNAGELIFTSDTTVDLYGGFSLNAGALVFDAAGIAGFDNSAEEVTLNVTSLSLKNTSGRSFTTASPVDGDGDLRVIAERLILGDNDVTVDGFANTRAVLNDGLLAAGDGQLLVDGNVQVQTPRVVGQSGATIHIEVNGALEFAHRGGARPWLNDGLGAAFSAHATHIDIDTVFDFAAGNLDFASSASGISFVLGDNALLSVAGVAFYRDPPARGLTDGTLYDDILAYAPAGTITLNATAGDISFSPTAVIDLTGLRDPRIALTPNALPANLSARYTRALGGALNVTSGGSAAFDLNAKVFAGGGSPSAGGAVAIVTEALVDENALVADLMQANFTREVSLRVRAGDLNLDQALTAGAIKLVVDAGNLNIGASITALGDANSEISLLAGNNVHLADTAVIAAAGQSSQVTLAAINGAVEVDPLAVLDLTGSVDGVVTLRAPRNGAGINISSVDPSQFLGASAIRVEGVEQYSGVAALAGALSSANSYFGNVASIETELFGAGGDPRYRLVPVIDITDSAAITLSANTDLSSRGFTGVLAIRSAADLNINASVSDGFNGLAATSRLLSDSVRDSWSLRFVAGADLNSADPLALQAVRFAGAATLDNLTIGAGRIVRTGIGDIELAAAGSIILANSSAVVYTAGRSSGLELDREKTLSGGPSRWIPGGGGDLRLLAGGDLIGPAGPTQTLQEWYAITDEVPGVFLPFPPPFGQTLPGSRGGGFMNFANFKQNFAALGGGNVSLDIAGDVNRVSVSAPTWVYLESDDDGSVLEGDFIARIGAGDITANVGGSLLSSQIFVGDGHAGISVGGKVNPTAADGTDGIAWFAVQDGDIELIARRDVEVQGVVDPAMVRANALTDRGFLSQGERSRFSGLSVGGQFTLGAITAIKNKASQILPGIIESALPATVELRAMGGDLNFARAVIQILPSAHGNFEALARGDVNLFNDTGTATGGLSISIADPPRGQQHDVAAMVSRQQTSNSDLGSSYDTNVSADPPSRTADTQRSFIVSTEGSVLGATTSPAVITVPEPILVSAARDVRNLVLSATNLRATDITRIEAGRDIRQTSDNAIISLNGPGQLHVVAGRTIELGQSAGIVTIGDSRNAALSDQGADLYAAAGFAGLVDYDNFINRYLLNSHAYDALVPNVAAFQLLDREAQFGAIATIFNHELRQSGVSATSTGSDDYSRAYTAIDTLFPGVRPAGDINLLFSRIQTIDGGAIRLLAPGGSINAGLAVAPSGAPEKEAGVLGIVALAAGDIEAYLLRNFLVNQSRVFTLGGGDISLFSRVGNIDAGRGAKSSLSAPPPRIVIANDGSVALDLSGAISGSGIRTVATAGARAGSVFLFAPQGIVNAGEAGIAGDSVFIGATEVIGADNIDVGGGVAVGVPAATSVSVAAGVAGATDAAGAAAQSATESAAQQSTAAAGSATNDPLAGALSIISVEVLGFGG